MHLYYLKKYPLAYSQVSNLSLEAPLHFTEIKHPLQGNRQRCPRDQLLPLFSRLPLVICRGYVHEKRE